MPITIEKYREKRTPEAMKNTTGPLLDQIRDFIEVLNDSDYSDTSYLKEELTPYIKALENLTSNNPEKFTKENIETLNGFYAFLKKDIKGNNVFSLLLLDNGLHLNDLDDSLNALKNIMEYTDEEFNLTTLKNSYSISNMGEAERKINVKEINNYDQLMAEKEKGKNFLEPGCREAKAVDSMLSEMSKAVNNKVIEDKVVKGKVTDSLKLYYDALKTIKEAPSSEKTTDEEKNKVTDALKTMSGFSKFLTDGVDKTNYQRLKDAGINMTVIDSGLKVVNKTLVKGIDAKSIKEAKPKMKTKELTALEFINSYKDFFRKNAGTVKGREDYPEKFYAKIMAARLLVNSERGKEETLKRNTTNIAIDKKADELLENETFKKFMETLKDPKVLREVESWMTSKYDHGGKLDDLFKTWLCNRPAGELDNSKLLERYMPTNLERIEALQKKAEAKMKKHEVPDKEMAEIILLRTSSKIERNQKDKLKNTRVNTDFPLGKAVDKLIKEPAISTLKVDSPAMKLLNEGHGGKMMEELKKSDKIELCPRLRNVLKVDYLANSDKHRLLKDRMEYIKNVAGLVLFDLDEELKKGKPDQKQIDKLKNLGKDLLYEELALTDIYKDTQAHPNNLQLSSTKNVYQSKGLADVAPTYESNPKHPGQILILDAVTNRARNMKADVNFGLSFLPLDDKLENLASIKKELETLKNAKDFGEIKDHCSKVLEAGQPKDMEKHPVLPAQL
ncbi:MAG: hypothetical protein IKO32_11630 [Lachnospiraceae bacterium]|nr:hypothetical protein [Lachnospiraceae bacterium]